MDALHPVIQSMPAAVQRAATIIARDPLTLAMTPNRIERPRDAVSVRNTIALTMLTAPMADADVARWTLDLYQSPVYLWSPLIIEGLTASDLPPHTVILDLPHPVTCHVFETPLSTGISGATLLMLVVSDTPHGIALFGVHREADGRLEPHSVQIPTGSRYPDDIEPEARAIVALVSMMVSFAASPATDVQRQRIDRAARRERARVMPDAPEPDVSVVTLRQPEGTARGDGERDASPYTHRWWVRGHWRAQWYPSVEAHQLIWVMPHVKGPGDKPLAPPSRRVYHVKH